MATWIAKYFASTAAARAAADAIQIHGADGCSPGYPVARYYRDAKVMGIIEGSTQIQQVVIAEEAYRWTVA
jgi:methoxymalonate biosynthesis protein